MHLPSPCFSCGVTEYHSYRVKGEETFCGSCVKIGYTAHVGIQHAQNIRQQRIEHKKDLLQPWQGDNISGDFVKAYPEESKEYFRPEDIKSVNAGLTTKYRPPLAPETPA